MQEHNTLSNIESELKIWKNVMKTSQESEEKKRANAYVGAIEPIVQELGSLDSVRLSEMEDSANTILGCLDDLWKLEDYTYPQDRMDRLLSLSSACFAEAMARKLKTAGLWDNSNNEADIQLLQALGACNSWIEECHRMTGLFWKNDIYHPWKGEPFQALNVLKIRDRIDQIGTILRTVKLTSKLLPSNNQSIIDPGYLFKSFQDLDQNSSPNAILDNREWKAAVIQFNDQFAQAEKEIAVALRPRLVRIGTGDPSALLDALLEYKELVQRPRIRRELESEGQTLLQHTKNWLIKFKEELARLKQMSSNSVGNVSKTLGEIQEIHEIQSQISNIQKGVHLFANQMEEASALEQDAHSLLQEIQELTSEMFDAWSRSALAGIRNHSLGLSSDEPVVVFDQKKLMKINYDSGLIQFVREARLLNSMGFKLAPQIVQKSQSAEAFMKQAKELEQIASFHNTIGDNILPCLKPLMLEAAVGLSNLVQEQNVVTWTQTENVNSYIRRLQQAVQRLEALNKQLTMCHEQIQEKVLKLFELSLLTEQQRWKDLLREIRLVIGTVEAQGYNNTKAWRLYWDHQLCKALEYQYCVQLEDLNRQMPDIQIELDFKKQTLQFKPLMEDIRREYYSRLRKFLSIPLHFKGLSESPVNAKLFAKILEKHSHLFVKVFANSGKVFTELEHFKEKFKRCVAPSLVDFDALLEKSLRQPEDWDTAFNDAKKRRNEIVNLANDDERVGCFIVSLAPLQREVEYIHRRYWDALTSSLYASIHRDSSEIINFASNAATVLATQPNGFEEFSEVSIAFNELLRTSPEMNRIMQNAEAKNQVLQRWSEDRVELYSQACAEWKSFNYSLTRHKDAINKQLDNLKSSTQSQILKFTTQVEEFHRRWQQHEQAQDILKSDGNNFNQYLTALRNFRNEWNELQETKIRMNSTLEKVGEKAVDLSVEVDIEKDISGKEEAWAFYQNFNDEMGEMGKEDWIVARNKIAKIDEHFESWMQRLNDSGTNHNIIDWLKSQVESYKSAIPLLKLSRGETFTERHWAEFFKIADLSAARAEQLTLQDLLKSRATLSQNLNLLKELNGRAAGESLVRQALSELEQWEAETRWILSQHVDSNGVQMSLIKDFKELLNKVGENLSLIQSVKDSSYYQAYSDRITLWENKMTDLDFYLRHLSQVQLKWLYLEPVFSKGTLSKEAGRFRRLDADFRFIIGEIKRDSRVTAILRISNLRSLVTNLLDQVGRCQKSLYEFLEDKRSKFARFYFLGDEDLLDIIGQASTKPAVIQPHLKKLFAGIHSVLFSNDQRQIVAVASQEGERVELKSPVSVNTDEVEIWLNKLVAETKSTLQIMLRECVQERQRDATDLSRFPSQILCLAEAVVFTERCEKAISSSPSGLTKLKNDYQNQLASYTSGPLLQNSGPDEQEVIVLKLQALIMDIIHYIDIIEQVITSKCRSSGDWAWQKQLRFYLRNDLVIARMASTEVEYTYEYQGNVAKLVHTPLTDKCYLTLTLALRMGLGGNPYGPAGTGKTESVKALGSLLGRQVLVFNCDEGLDVKSMGRIFVGLAKSGTWGCFDEFNRLDENTLSTVSTLIHAIQLALKNRNSTVTLLGSQIEISSHTGIFVTLNPAGKEYGGRQKLPDNLKLLFRPVVMSEPDIEMIAEVILFSQGFREAKILGKKLVDTFRLAQKLLSRQQHYDWGLRALKSVLRTAGDALRAALATQGSEELEYTVLVRALNFNTLSKLTTADSALFLGLVNDIFPNAKQQSDSSHANLIQLIRSCCGEMGLVFLDRQVKKVLEVYEQARQRMGVVIVGPPLTGKSTVCTILKKVLHCQNKKVHSYTLNPKAISRSQLLGLIDPSTREWTDGVLTKISRNVVAEADTPSWIICDGDIDPEWIEALNSVLDDNRLLTMASGERIKFGPEVNFIFETHDLTYASPATISRMGVVYFGDDDIDFQVIIEQWIRKQPEEQRATLKDLTKNYLLKAVEWIEKNGECVMPVSSMTIIKGMLSQLVVCRSKTEFVHGILKGGAANLTAPARSSFAQMVVSLSQIKFPNPENPLVATYNEKQDALVPLDQNELTLSESSDGHLELLVPTTTLQTAYSIISPWLTNKEHVLVVGPEACGKSILLDYCLRQMRSTRVVAVNCSATTSPHEVLHKVLQNSIVVSSTHGQVLCPREASTLVLYLKDLNIVVPDKWGTCQLIAFLEQMINYKGCYDNNGEWLVMENIQLVASYNVNHSQGRFQLSPRFTSLLRIAAVSDPQLNELESLALGYLQDAFKKSKSGPATKILPAIASFIVQFDNEIRGAVLSKQTFKNLFTNRDLTSWAEGLARYEIRWDDQSLMMAALGYEACRIYRDRLTSCDQRTKFDAIAKQLFSEKLKSGFNPTGGIFSTYRSKRNGLLLVSQSEWEQVVQKTLQQYGRENEQLDIALLPELLDTVARCDRVLSNPASRSLLLIGRSGVGRHTAVRLVSVLHKARIMTPYPGKNYRRKQFINDLKSALHVAGVEGELIFYVLEEHHFSDPNFYAMLDSLLASGEIPGIYTNEEIEAILSPLKEIAAQESYGGNMISYFARRVKNNLRVIFLLDTADPSFEILVESHPAMYKLSDTIWMENWSKQSMMSVAHRILKSNQMATQELEKSLTIYNGLDDSLQCPRRFVAFIETFSRICSEKSAKIVEKQQRIRSGVSKLSEARELVARLQAEAAQQERLLEQKQTEAKVALQKITDTIQSAGVKRDEMQDLRSSIAEENIKLNQRKQAIDQELAEIEPLLAEARAAVSDIRNEALTEIRSLRAPPEVIRDILEGVLRLMGILDTSWTSMKSFLAKRGVKDEIRSFDARKITSESRRAVEQLMTRKGESFDVRVAKRASAAAAPLAAWVQANVSFARVLERIKPLEDEQALLTKNLRSAEHNISRLSSGLDDVDKQVAELREQLAVSTREASEIEIGLNKARQTLSASENLVMELAGEYDRWRSQLEYLESEERTLVAHALLSAAFINFLSCATEDIRKGALSRWLDQMEPQRGDENESKKARFCLKSFLSDEQELMQWRSEGLASDDLAVENALAILHGSMYPYVLDATGKSIHWIAAHFKAATVEITSQSEERFANVLDLAIRFGKILIVQDAEVIDPILYPIIRNDYLVQGVRKLVRLGDKLVDWNENFRIFLFARTAVVTQSMSPQANALVNTINFNTTEAGLAEQLVALTVKHENPDLEERKKQLLEQEEKLKLQLAELEEKLLVTLGRSQGNILENTEVLSSLRELKHSSATIGQSLKESLQLQSSLDKERSGYRELAIYASRLYFAVRDLAKVNPCYQFAIPAFMQIYLRNLKSTKIDDGSERLEFIRQRLLKTVYSSVSRAIFKCDKLLVAAHIVHEMYPKSFKQNEWEMFAGLIIGHSSSSPIELPDWIDESRANNIKALKAVLPSLYSHLRLDDVSLWSKPGVIPAALGQELTPFQQVLVTQILFPDKLVGKLANFLSRTLEIPELFPAASSLLGILEETSAEEPILVLLPGDDGGAYDLTAELEELSVNVLGPEMLVEIAMGTEETEKATEAIVCAASKGQWVCLKNVHLVTGWLPSLERLMDQLIREGEGIHKKFRLWLTAEPVTTLPVSLLQQCMKIVSEAPQGMKRNLNRTLDYWNHAHVPTSPIQLQAIFILAWFHAVVQERRNYVPQGWLKRHEFNEADFRAGLEVLEQSFREHSESSNRWEYVNGLLFHVIYGGRVDNNFDLRILRSYLSQYFSDDILGQQQPAIDNDTTIPLSKNVQDYLGIVRRLPDSDKSSCFGLPPNIDATIQYNQGVYLVNRLKAFYQATSTVTNEDAKLLMNRLSPIFQLWKSLIQGTSLLTNKDSSFSSLLKADSSPLFAFVIAESNLAMRSIQVFHHTLSAINRALKGSLSLPVALMESASELAAMKTPKVWYSLWEGPLQVELYLRSVVKRARALTEQWLPAAQKNDLLSNILDLSQLMSPEAFFSVLRQHTARETKVQMDSLVLSATWDENSIGYGRASNKLVARLSGLYMQGARMRPGSGLEECSCDTPSWNPIPHCFLSWTAPGTMSFSTANDSNAVEVPLYVDEERQRLITVLKIPYKTGRVDDWLRVGIAMSLKD